MADAFDWTSVLEELDPTTLALLAAAAGVAAVGSTLAPLLERVGGWMLQWADTLGAWVQTARATIGERAPGLVELYKAQHLAQRQMERIAALPGVVRVVDVLAEDSPDGWRITVLDVVPPESQLMEDYERRLTDIPYNETVLSHFAPEMAADMVRLVTARLRGSLRHNYEARGVVSADVYLLSSVAGVRRYVSVQWDHDKAHGAHVKHVVDAAIGIMRDTADTLNG